MFCANCGKKLDDHVKFCTDCGTVVSAPPAPTPEPVIIQTPKPIPPKKPVSAPILTADPVIRQNPNNFSQAPTTPIYNPTPAPQKKKMNPLVVILPVALVVLLVVVLVIGLITGVLGSDKSKVVSAFGKSALAYTDAYSEMDLPELTIPVKDGVYSQSTAVKLKELPTAPELEGLGISLDVDANLLENEVYLQLTPAYSNVDILSAEVLLQNDKLYLASSDILGDRVYVVNTETLGQDLVSLTGDEEIASLGFNVYELIQIAKDSFVIDEDLQQELTDAITALAKEIEADKTGKKEIRVNGSTVKCTVYHMTISEDSLAEILHIMEKISSDRDVVELTIDLFKAIGAPDYAVESLREELSYQFDTDSMYDTFDDILDEIGDLELDVYVNKGYVMGLYYEGSIEDADIELNVRLGGGKEYVDDLSVELLVDDAEILVESTGNHACKDGVFTDSTTIDISIPNSNTVSFTSEMSFEPQSEDENFYWELDAEYFEIELSGQITMEETAQSIHLDKVALTVEGEQMLELSVSTDLTAYEPGSMSTKNAVEILKLSQEELMTEAYLIQENASVWAEAILSALPGELLYALEYMM